MAPNAPRRRDALYANGLALVASAGASAALGFVFWMVVARRFHPDAVGIGAAVVSAATLAALIGKAGFDAAVIRYAPTLDAAGARKLLTKTALATVALTAFVAAAVLAFAVLGVSALAPLRQPAFAVGFLVLAVGTGAAWILDALFIAEQRSWAVLARNVAFNAVKIFVPLFVAFEWGGRVVPLAWAVGLAASLSVALVLLPRALAAHTRASEPPAGRALNYAMRNFALNLSEFLPGLVLPLIVLDALGAEENARFFLAWTVATVAFLASKAIAQSAFAALVRHGDPRPPVRKAVLLSAALLGPAAIALYLGAPLVLRLFGEHYAPAAPLLSLLAASIPAIVASNLYLAYLKAREPSWELTALPVASLALLAVTLPLALARGGIEGVGVAWLCVQALVGAYAAIRLRAKLQRMPHVDPRTRLRRHPHEG